jgi:hypothetical protein
VTHFHRVTDDGVSSEVQDAILSYVEALQALLGGVIPVTAELEPGSVSDINADARQGALRRAILRFVLIFKG